MPVFYGQPVPLPASSEQHNSKENHRKQLKRDYLGNIMGTRGSASPENGAMNNTTEEGRPISRGEIIERLKRTKQQTWFSDQNERPTIAIEHRLSSEHVTDALLARTSQQLENHDAGIRIERPRSALHAGDFREQATAPNNENITTSTVQTRSFDSPRFERPASYSSFHVNTPQHESAHLSFGSRSYTSTFLPPTSPLIHASTSTDLEDIEIEQSPSISSRRRTFSPPSFQSSRSEVDSSSLVGRLSSHLASRAHQPHRSISIPHAAQLRPRGISNASDASPLQHAPMVGSYEESILRGRMSATPSRPLDFIAQIGVLGKGKCKPSLRCPAHVTVPFPAVFYSYNGTANPAVASTPSPYVGLIDIESAFPEYDGKAPSGGCYRIPQQGQLQIIIKNPNKTAVKLFLVPYDLRDMEPGSKTFIRQRSYSAGPIIDMPVSSRTNLGTDRPEASLSQSEDPTDRPTLRYLIHLHICCTSRGRYFLYRSIRVVFANRVPDGKEKLRNEVQLPDPRYVPYRPGSTLASTSSSPRDHRSSMQTELSQPRLSTPFAFAAFGMDQADGLVSGPASQGALPLSAAAIQRNLDTPTKRNSTLSHAVVRAPTLIGSSTADQQTSAVTNPASPGTPSNEPVLMESFDTWLNRRRRNAESSNIDASQ